MNSLRNTQDSNTENMTQVGKRKNFFISLFTNIKHIFLFILFLSILPALFLVYAGIIPISSYKPAAEIGGGKPMVSVSIDASQKEDVSKIILLEKENNFEKNSLSLADQDSIYLVINVPSKSIAIEIKGVQVRTATILNVIPDQKLALISHEHLTPWLSDPFVLKKYLGTIPKIPIVVKEAPKDTIEAQLRSSKPLPPDSTIVFTSLFFDRNLILEINQNGEPNERELPIVKAYLDKKTAYSPDEKTIEKILNPGATDHPVTIKLIVSAADARAIYRAIPSKTRLVLKL